MSRGTVLDAHLDVLNGQLGPGWLDRLEFVIVEQPSLGPSTIVVDPGTLRVFTGDVDAFRAAIDWSNLELDVRAIFTASLRRLAARWGVTTHGLPRRRVR